MELKLTGEKQLGRAFHQFPRKFASKGIKRVLRDAMKAVVHPEVKKNIAKDQGDLRRDVKVRTAKGRNGKRLPRTIIGTAVLVAKVPHAKYVLFDRRLRDGRIRPGDRTLRDALYGNQFKLRYKIKAGLQRALPIIARESRGTL